MELAENKLHNQVLKSTFGRLRLAALLPQGKYPDIGVGRTQLESNELWAAASKKHIAERKLH
eukprot:4427473-Amphidinium_carterae.1